MGVSLGSLLTITATPLWQVGVVIVKTTPPTVALGTMATEYLFAPVIVAMSQYYV